MKSIDELDHYELLEISRSASPGEIDRAYRLAQDTYSEGSLALYSVFESMDAAAIRGRLDEAYRILADPETREAYDRECLVTETPAAREASRHGADAIDEAADGIAGSREAEGGGGFLAGPIDETSMDAFEEIANEFDALEDDGKGDFDGVRLRRTRLFRGYEIEDISDVTKVSGAHLRNIEEENFDDLPADVYVRGFVTAYAKTIGLDPKQVVPGYMARVAESRSSGQTGGFLGRGQAVVRAR